MKMENQTTYRNKDEWGSIQISRHTHSNTLQTNSQKKSQTGECVNNGRKSLKIDLIKSNKMMIVLEVYRITNDLFKFFWLPKKMAHFFQNHKKILSHIFITIYCNCNCSEWIKQIYGIKLPICKAKESERENKILWIPWVETKPLLFLYFPDVNQKRSKRCIVNQIESMLPASNLHTRYWFIHSRCLSACDYNAACVMVSSHPHSYNATS